MKYSKDEGELLSDPTSYHKLIGNLIYLTMAPPDISFAIQIVSQFVLFLDTYMSQTFLKLFDISEVPPLEDYFFL